jgi:thioredoxin-like negative regulator of GroEL
MKDVSASDLWLINNNSLHTSLGESSNQEGPVIFEFWLERCGDTTQVTLVIKREGDGHPIAPPT